MVNIETIMKFEQGELGQEETIEMFQQMIDDGSAWTLQGYYGRMAMSLIDMGLCTPKGK
jgi:hypothetical protein